ncbi:RusA family crossover junction endodeoxyribonuclease [Sediminibacillus massiliensis]|uniref:RusA family crossover junction endodeoxyribonuclease n=1 Tax=Sediminibacillus massiliensis TaxID=1926277 RepID=UPI0009885477|nr:RusA family crossover junction endodeoxyribonuclease [Sediminibacillus massiliensis]
MIQFTVLGEAVAQGRPRAGKNRKGKTVVYDPGKSKDYKQYVRLVAQQHAPKMPIEGPVVVFIKVYKPLLSNMSKKRREEAEAGLYRPITKPDVDNYGKAVADALNQIIWKDDSQIVEMRVSKFYSEKPRIEVRVEVLEEMGA